MAKDKLVYVCSECGQESQKWVGKCPSCGKWNTFKEIRVAAESVSSIAKSAASASSLASTAGKLLRSKSRPLLLREISTDEEPRIDMHDSELNRVLGGGLVHG